MGEIIAALKKTPELQIKLEKVKKLEAKLTLPSVLTAKISSFIREIPVYEESYIIEPAAFKAQELQTKNKKMEENLTVLEIPYYNVSNEKGNTIYIGSEVEINGN